MLKIIGAGFGRTGTHSLKNALELIGFGPCYHMVEVFQHPEHVPVWQAAADRQEVHWEDIFHDYVSAVDWPTAAFYRPLMQRYPDAKVILTVRDFEGWYRSVQNTIGRRHFDDQPDSPQQRMIMRVIWNGIFSDRFDDRAYALDIFEKHVRDVKYHVPAQRLLVYDVREGWGPLCQFLNCAIPEDTPFPHLNTSEDWAKREAEPESGPR